jgi:negative regulator of sigma-B (phosphoserine phosphatase)
MKTRRSSSQPLLEWGVAGRELPGEEVSGDLHLVQPFAGGALAAVVDGLGHGAEAAAAAQKAVATLRDHAHESVLPLVRRCHAALRDTRGVVLTLASFNAADGTMTWVGVGNVEGVLIHAEEALGQGRDYVLLHGGVVGHQLPPLRAFVIPVARGDTLVLATDGIRPGFAEGLPPADPPQHLADRILARDFRGTDDALVVVARYQGGGS